jgi:hypothetical protein
MSFPASDQALTASAAEPVTPALDLADDPTLAVSYLLAGGLMEICGPLFWTVLAGGFLFSEFWLD